MKYSTYIDILLPKEKFFAIKFEVVLLFVLSMMISFSAHLKIFLPFTPVPITFQTFTVLFISMLVGARRSLFIILIYIFQGIIGLPVFASGAGVRYILGPTGGYILGFLIGGYVVGFLAERGFDRDFYRTFIAMFLGNIIIYLFGVLWLSKFVTGIYKAIIVGVVPFIVVDVIKIIIAGFVLPLGWKFINRYNVLP